MVSVGLSLIPAALTWLFPGERKIPIRLFFSAFWVMLAPGPEPRRLFFAALFFLGAVMLFCPPPTALLRLGAAGGWMTAFVLGFLVSAPPGVTALLFLLGGVYLLLGLRETDAYHRGLLTGLGILSVLFTLYAMEGHLLLLGGAALLFIHLGYREGLMEPEIAFIPSLSRELMAGMPVGVLIVDDRNRVVWENETARNLLAPRKIRGKNLESLFGAIPLDSRETSYVLTPDNRAYLVWKVPVQNGMVYLLHPVDAFVQSFREVNLKAVQYEKLASLDPLTGVFNRRVLFPVLEEAYRRFHEEGIPFSLIMLDLDGFKSLNDRYGHELGDEVLRTLAQFLRKHLRKTDVVVRYGGDEFVLVLPGTSLREGLFVASQIKKRWQRVSFPESVHVQFCMGVVDASHLPGDVEDALRSVDDYLYKAKATGSGVIVSPLFTA